MMVDDFAGDRVLERMLMYERRIEGSLYRTTAEFRKLRAERKAGGCISRRSAAPLIPDDHPIWGRSPARGPQPAWEPGRGGNPPGADRLQEILDEAARMAAWAGDSDATDLPQDQEQLCQTNPISGVGANTPEVQEQMRQTKPIGGLDERQVLGGQEVTTDSPQGEAGRAQPQEAGYRLVHCVGRPAVRS